MTHHVRVRTIYLCKKLFIEKTMHDFCDNFFSQLV